MGKIDINCYLKCAYEEFYALRLKKNKANLKPIKANWLDLAEILVLLMVLIVFAADSRYNSHREWIFGNLTG